MTRDLKALGLAVIAAFAISAASAAGAQAERGAIVADVGADLATITGTPIEPEETNPHQPEVGSGELVCYEALEGTIQDQDLTLTLTPRYETCTTIDFLETQRTTTIDPTGCDYLLTGGNETANNPNHIAGITFSLKCPNSEETVRITVYNGTEHSVGHEVGKRRCEYSIHQFGPHLVEGAHAGGVTAENTFPQNLPDDVYLTFPDSQFTRTFGTFLQCGAATQETNFVGAVTLRAYADEAHRVQVDLTLTDYS